MDPFRNFVRRFEDACRISLKAPTAASCRHPRQKAAAPVALVFSPHPDDEAITGALPLRLQHEAGARIVNVAVTLGSDPARRAARRREVAAACASLGWEHTILGWDRVIPGTAQRRPTLWKKWVRETAMLIRHWQPRWVFYPHRDDGHPAHAGVNLLVESALQNIGSGKRAPLWRVQTEYWRPLAAPNLLVECPPKQLARLVAALCCHQGEIVRNPYHLSLPAWMMDNVRRGAELVGGHGARAPRFSFGTLYRVEPRRPVDWKPLMPATIRLR